MADETDIRNDLIRLALQEGSTFADVGGLWGTVSEKVSVAERAGASERTMIDILPLTHPLWRQLRDRLAEIGAGPCNELSLNLDHATADTGTFDVVHCSGVVYHVPNPIHTLCQLRLLTSGHLVVTAMSIPEHIENDVGRIDLLPGQSLLVPSLSPRDLAILARHWELVGVSNAIGIDIPADYTPDNYGPWWWLPTPSALEGWVRLAGFSVERSEPFWGGRSHTILAKRTP